MNPIVPPYTPDSYQHQSQDNYQYQHQHQHQHSFDPSGYSSSQHSQHGILSTPTPYMGAEDKPGPFINAQEISEHQNPNRRPWNTAWLSVGALLSFVVFFIALVAALVSVYTLSQRSDGFEAGTQSTRYAWKYIPTAIIVIISALWTRLDYFCRLLSPWQNLKKGPVSLEKGLLLDYISPTGPVVILKSIKNRDWAVAMTGIGALLLKIAVSTSSGLRTQVLANILPGRCFNGFILTPSHGYCCGERAYG